MQRITTNTALEHPAFTIGFADVSTIIASLTRIVTVYQDNALAEHCSFVLDKVQKLICTPSTNQAASFFPCFAFPFHTDMTTSEEARIEFTKRMSEINEAYSEIKKERGM